MPSVLISGASTGIGEACVLDLAARGWTVFAGVRRDEDGERLRRASFDATRSDRLRAVRLDVADDASVRAAAALVADAVGREGLTGLVNNAGIVVGAPLEFLPMADLRRQMEVNYFGTVALTQACLATLRRAGPGVARIVMMSSIAGRTYLPFAWPYCTSKHAMEATSDGLRVELRPWGIKVILVEPGAIATPIWDKSLASSDELESRLPAECQRLYGAALATFKRESRKSGARGIPVARVARVVRLALEARRPRRRYLVGLDARVLNLMHRCLPGALIDWSMSRVLGGGAGPAEGAGGGGSR